MRKVLAVVFYHLVVHRLFLFRRAFRVRHYLVYEVRGLGLVPRVFSSLESRGQVVHATGSRHVGVYVTRKFRVVLGGLSYRGVFFRSLFRWQCRGEANFLSRFGLEVRSLGRFHVRSALGHYFDACRASFSVHYDFCHYSHSQGSCSGSQGLGLVLRYVRYGHAHHVAYSRGYFRLFHPRRASGLF